MLIDTDCLVQRLPLLFSDLRLAVPLADFGRRLGVERAGVPDFDGRAAWTNSDRRPLDRTPSLAMSSSFGVGQVSPSELTDSPQTTGNSPT